MTKLVKVDIQVLELSDRKIAEVKFSRKIGRWAIPSLHELIREVIDPEIQYIFTTPFLKKRDHTIFVEVEHDNDVKLIGQIE